MTPNIQCAKCKKQVDRVVVTHFAFEQSNEVKVWCHGAIDVMRVDDSELVKLGQKGLDAMLRDGGIAFATDRIGRPE